VVEKQNSSIRLREFLTPFEILPYDEKETKYYGELRARLEKKRQVMGSLDMLITTSPHATSRDLILVLTSF